jgi:hypothetical protein
VEIASWLAHQRHSLPRLHVEAGEYLARWSPRNRSYRAGAKLSDPLPGEYIVLVEALPHDAAVHATVRQGEAEYVFEPQWIRGRGLSAHRLSPSAVARPTADQMRGLATAALHCAAERSYDRLHDLAIDIAGAAWPELLLPLTLGDSLGPFEAATLAALRGRPLAELITVRAWSLCLACSEVFEAGEIGPVFEVMGFLVLCARCHRGEARAA